MNSYIAAVRKCGRMASLFLLLLLILGSAGSHQARANGVVSTIGNGQIVYGSVSGTGYDTYSFPAASGDYISWTVTATSAYNSGFEPFSELFRPAGTEDAAASDYYFAGDFVDAGSTGTWKIEVSNNFSYPVVSGGYALQVFVLPGTPAQSGGVGGGQMNVGQTYDGSINLGSSDVYTFNGVSGNNYSLTLDRVSGSASFDPWMIWSDSTGSLIEQNWTASTYTFTHSATTGPYTVVVNQAYNGNNSGDYSLEASGTGTSPPVAGKQDGGRCIPCEEAAKAQEAGEGPPPQSLDITSAGGTNGGTDPINIATGNLYEKVTDYTTVGTNPLALVRSYNSMSYNRNEFPTLMGVNWRTNFDRYIRVVSASQATAERPGRTGSQLRAERWHGDAGYRCRCQAHIFRHYLHADRFRRHGRNIYRHERARDVLSSIAWPNGYTQTINYTSGVLTSVSDSYSRSLSFTYTSGVLTGVTTPDSATLTYAYTTTAGQSLLTSVTYNTSPSTQPDLRLRKHQFPFMLTGITDENGNSFASVYL